MIETLKNWIFRIKDYDRLLTTTEMHKAIIEKMQMELSRLKVDISLNGFSLPTPSRISYSAPASKLLTKYLEERVIQGVTDIAYVIIDDFGLKANNPDKVPISVLKWLDKQFKEGKFKYKREVGEKWRTPEQTLKLRYGDCDDFSILEYYICRTIFKILGIWGICQERLYCVVGGVNARGDKPDPKELHAYLAWRAFKDDKYYPIETTFYRGMSIIEYLRVPHRHNTRYNYFRYIFNDKNSYKLHSFRGKIT